MSNRRRRYVWQVELGNGEVLFVNHLSTARLTLHASWDRPGARRLRRAGKGSYYYIETYATPAGVRTQLVRVHRVPAGRAEVERVNERLPFVDIVHARRSPGEPDGL